MCCRESVIRTPDAQRLFVRHYIAEPPARRTLLLVHGASEHGARYEHVAGEFATRGWNVVVADLRGHGQSDGVRTHIRDFRQYVQDVETVRTTLDLSPDATAVLGHSMGGLVAIRHAQCFPGRVAALVLSSPLLRVKVAIPRRTVALGRVLSLVAPRTRFRSRIDPTHVTRCPVALARRVADPLVQRSVTARWFFAMRAALRTAWTEAPRLTLPLMLIQAGEDRVVDAAASAEWIGRTGSADGTLRVLPDHFHEVLNEPDWPETVADIAEWLDGRVAERVEPACAA